MPETPDTEHFGLTRISEGEQLSKNGWAALDGDRITLDDLLHALSEHAHDGSVRLADPVGAPSLVARGTGGTLPADTTLYYRISYLDRWGLETAGSSESYITTSQALDGPTSLAANVEVTSGSLPPGLYSYIATYGTPSGGESTAGPRTDVRVGAGGTSRVRLDLPDLPPGASVVRVYRARPGQQAFYFLLESDAEFVYDDGSLTEDATVNAPGYNSTSNTNSVEVTVPGNALPEGVTGWRLYRSVTPGTYSGTNLVHTVVEGVTDEDEAIRTTWIDQGEGLERGEPRESSATLGGGLLVSADAEQAGGQVQILSSFAAGELTTGGVINEFFVDKQITPKAISAFFQIAPGFLQPGAGERRDGTNLRSTESFEQAAQVALRLKDEHGNVAWVNTGHVAEHTPADAKFALRLYSQTSEGRVQAETGEHPDAPIASDQGAFNGQATELQEINSSVDMPLGVLDRGLYRAWVRVRRVDTGAPVESDVAFEVFEASTQKRHLAHFQTVNTGAFTEYGPFEFTSGPLPQLPTPVRLGDLGGTPPPPPTEEEQAVYRSRFIVLDPIDVGARGQADVAGTDLIFRVSKAQSTPAVYHVDQIRYEAVQPRLGPGRITVYADVADPMGRLYQRHHSEVPAPTRLGMRNFNPDFVSAGGKQINGFDYADLRAIDARWTGHPDNATRGTMLFLSSDRRPMHANFGMYKMADDRLIERAEDMDPFYGNTGHRYQAYTTTYYSTQGNKTVMGTDPLTGEAREYAGGHAWSEAFRVEALPGQTATTAEFDYVAVGHEADGVTPIYERSMRPVVTGTYTGGLITLRVTVDWDAMRPGDVALGTLEVRSRAVDSEMPYLIDGSPGYRLWLYFGGSAVANVHQEPRFLTASHDDMGIPPLLHDKQTAEVDPESGDWTSSWGFHPAQYDGTDAPPPEWEANGWPASGPRHEKWFYRTYLRLTAVKALDNLGGNVNLTLNF